MNLLVRICFYLLILFLFISFLSIIKKKYPKANLWFLVFLFFYRLPYLFIYLKFLPGDWQNYYSKSKSSESFIDILGLGTDGVVALNYPLVKLGLSIPDTFLAFSFAGYIGVVLFYLIGHKLTDYTDKVLVWRINIYPWILLYPSLHMYTVMLGKDPIVLLGVALVGFSLLFYKINIPYLIAGLVMLLLVRPHIVFVVIASLIIALFWSKEMVNLKKYALVFLSATLGVIFLPLIFKFFRVGNVSLEAIQIAIQLNESYESTAGTYIDMSAYPLWLKAFTYLFRPLFFDSPNIILLEYSAENLIFLLLTLSLLRLSFPLWINTQPRIIKFSLIFFILGTLVLSNGLSVFGLFIRQKTMVFLFLILVIIGFIYFNNQRRMVIIKKQC